MRFRITLPEELPDNGGKKRRYVRISKAEVYKDIDLFTHKTVDGSGNPDPQVRNAVSSDITESVDGAVLARHVQFRDAQLRRRLAFALVEIEQEAADDTLPIDDNHFHYCFLVDDKFKDALLRPLAEYIHRFLVFGALFDWYSKFDMAQAKYYGSQIDGLEDEIASLLYGTSIYKRPLQPFGPALPLNGPAERVI
jgi:hypothetical protein